MTVELRPLGVACNISCTYCYQEPMRESGNINTKYDVDHMLEVAEKTGQRFSLFGGEALLVPKKDLEKFWKRGYELFKENGVQTNGTLIDDDHIELFKKYNVSVGVSIDGPNELNSLRQAKGNKDIDMRTQANTEKTMNNILKLVQNNIGVSVIITIHKLNGVGEKLDRLINFIKWLGDIGVTTGNIHTLEVDKTMPDQEIHVLTQEENAESFLKLAEFFESNPNLNYNPFSDNKKIMSNKDYSTNCTWNFCDSMNTQAVYGIEGNGSLSNCGRTNKEGIDFFKSDDNGYERYISLYNSPDELGGCQGCRFFIACSGSCPGESADNDFRNKTIHCETQKMLLGYYEKLAVEKGETPFSVRDDLKEIEEVVMDSLLNNAPLKIQDAISAVEYNNNNNNKNIRLVELR